MVLLRNELPLGACADDARRVVMDSPGDRSRARAWSLERQRRSRSDRCSPPRSHDANPSAEGYLFADIDTFHASPSRTRCMVSVTTSPSGPFISMTTVAVSPSTFSSTTRMLASGMMSPRWRA